MCYPIFLDDGAIISDVPYLSKTIVSSFYGPPNKELDVCASICQDYTIIGLRFFFCIYT